MQKSNSATDIRLLQNTKVPKETSVAATKSSLKEKLSRLETKTDELLRREAASKKNKLDINQYLERIENSRALPKIKMSKMTVNEADVLEGAQKILEIDGRSKLEKMREKAIESQRNAINYVNLRKQKDYTYIANEKKFCELKEQEILEKELKIEEVRNERKQFFKPMKKDELEAFERKYLEERERLLIEKEVSRLEEINNCGKLKVELSSSYLKVSKNYAEERDKMEKERLLKLYQMEKLKNFSKIVQEKLPKIDEKSKAEREERIKSLSKRPERSKRQERLAPLTKPNGWKPPKKKFLPPLVKEEVDLRRSKSQGMAAVATRKISREKKPKVLEINRSREINLSKLMKGKTGKESIDSVRFKIESLEEKVRRKEEFLAASGGVKEHPELAEHLGNMMCNALNGKLAILNNIEEGEENKEEDEMM